MTFERTGTGTGVDNSIPKIREQEGNENSIPKIQTREGYEKINSHNSGTGIRGFLFGEWMGTGISAHP